MSKPQENASSAGQYADSPIILTTRRASAAPPAQPTRKRSGRQPEPDHQQGSTFGIHPADDNYDSGSFALEGADYPGEPERLRSSVVHRQRVPSRQRETIHFQAKPTTDFTRRRFDRATLVIWLCLALIMMVGGWWLMSTISTWWTNWQDDLHYGNPRTFQVDQFVGQGDSPSNPDHFLVVNAHGRVIVIQLNLQHPELDQTYGITTADPNTPVSLHFRPTGTTWAMYVIVEESTPYSVELVSNGKQFVSPH